MKPPLRWLLLGALIVAAAAARCDRTPASRPEAGGLHVVVLGSSTAYGWGPAHPESAWVNRFRRAAQAVDPGRTVTNLAWPGYTTYHLMPDGFVPPDGRPTPDTARNITEAVQRGADAIIINLPSNDAIHGWPVETQLANYEIMLAAARGIPVWITTTQPRNTTDAGRANLVAMKDSTLARWGDRAADFWAALGSVDGTVPAAWDSGDGVHLNDAAHGVLFARIEMKNVWDAVGPLGAADVPGASSRQTTISP